MADPDADPDVAGAGPGTIADLKLAWIAQLAKYNRHFCDPAIYRAQHPDKTQPLDDDIEKVLTRLGVTLDDAVLGIATLTKVGTQYHMEINGLYHKILVRPHGKPPTLNWLSVRNRLARNRIQASSKCTLGFAVIAWRRSDPLDCDETSRSTSVCVADDGAAGAQAIGAAAEAASATQPSSSRASSAGGAAAAAATGSPRKRKRSAGDHGADDGHRQRRTTTASSSPPMASAQPDNSQTSNNPYATFFPSLE
eukprot:c6487_g1_i1.p1 GENE.c6487_g1_i1~~c6487_g1_i1.p1  ORF type:complete len:252 (-),score=40.56 c6487_g1_i1:354-1109(-)